MKAFSLALILSLLGRGVLSQGVPLYQGCYSVPGSLRLSRPDDFQSPGACLNECTVSGSPLVFALTKVTDCWCGDSLPLEQFLVDNSLCDAGCPGFISSTCMIYLFPLDSFFIAVIFFVFLLTAEVGWKRRKRKRGLLLLLQSRNSRERFSHRGSPDDRTGHRLQWYYHWHGHDNRHPPHGHG